MATMLLASPLPGPGRVLGNLGLGADSNGGV